MSDEGEIMIKLRLTDRHDGMLFVVKEQNEGGGDGAVTVGQIPVRQLARFDEPLDRRVIIVVGHGDSMRKMGRFMYDVSHFGTNCCYKTIRR